LGVGLDVLWGTIERVRQQAARAREQLTEQIWEVRAAKEQALAAQEFERAAGLRDQERELTEQAHTQADLPPEVLQEITRRLGIPGSDDPPPPPALT